MAKIKDLNKQLEAAKKVECLLASIKGVQKFIDTSNPGEKINISFYIPPEDISDYGSHIETAMICEDKAVLTPMIIKYRNSLIVEINFLLDRYEIILDEKEMEILTKAKGGLK